MTAETLSVRLAAGYPDDACDGPDRLADATANAYPGTRRATPRPTTADVVADVTELLCAGVSAENVCARMGRTPAGLSRRLYRAERPDLGRPFAALAERVNYWARKP